MSDISSNYSIINDINMLNDFDNRSNIDDISIINHNTTVNYTNNQQEIDKKKFDNSIKKVEEQLKKKELKKKEIELENKTISEKYLTGLLQKYLPQSSNVSFYANLENIYQFKSLFNKNIFNYPNNAKDVILQLAEHHKNFLYDDYLQYREQCNVLQWIINNVKTFDEHTDNYEYKQFYKQFLKKMYHVLHHSVDMIHQTLLPLLSQEDLDDLQEYAIMLNEMILMNTEQQLCIERQLAYNEHDISYCCKLLLYWYAINKWCEQYYLKGLIKNKHSEYNYNPATKILKINNIEINISNNTTGTTKKTLNAKLSNFIMKEQADFTLDNFINFARNIILFLHLPDNNNIVDIYDNKTKTKVQKDIEDIFVKFSQYCDANRDKTIDAKELLIVNYALLCMHNQIYLSSPYNDINNKQNIIKNNNEPAPISSNNGPNLQFDDNNQPQEVILENFIKNNNSNIKNNDKNNDTEQEENKNNNIDQQQNNEKNNNTPEYSTPNNDNLKEEVNKPNTVNDNQLLSDQQKKIMLIAGIIVPIIGAVIVFIIVIIVKHTIKQNDKNTIKYFNKNNNFKDIKNHNEYFLNEHYNNNNLRHL